MAVGIRGEYFITEFRTSFSKEKQECRRP